jgi:hypothetical protein
LCTFVGMMGQRPVPKSDCPGGSILRDVLGGTTSSAAVGGVELLDLGGCRPFSPSAVGSSEVAGIAASCGVPQQVAAERIEGTIKYYRQRALKSEV